MKLLLSILAFLILTSSAVYLYQYKSIEDYQNEDQLQAYETDLVYYKETGALQWNLQKKDLDAYQMLAIKKTMQRRFIQKHIQSDFITKLDIDLSDAKNVVSIKPILEGIASGFDYNLKDLKINCNNLKIDINDDFINWKLPSQIQNFELSLNVTPTKSLKDILISMNTYTSNLKSLKLSVIRLDSNMIFDQSFAGIMLPKLDTFHLEIRMDNEQENFDNLAKTLSYLNLIDLKLNFLNCKFKQVDSSLQILGDSQRYLKNVDISFYLNSSNIYSSRKTQFTESLINLLARNNLKRLNLNLSGIKIDKQFLTFFEDYLYDVSQSQIQVYLNIQSLNVLKSQAIEIFEDISQIMQDKLKIKYPY